MKILMVDDEPMIRQALCQTLIKKGHEALQAGSAVEALRHFPIADFDLIVVDVDMPMVSGEEFLDILQRQAIRVPALILTARHPWEFTSQRDEGSWCKTMSKDVSLEKIVHEIERFLFQAHPIT